MGRGGQDVIALMVIGRGVTLIGQASLLMYVLCSKGHVIIREKREREWREEEMNGQTWQRLGGHWRGSMVLGQEVLVRIGISRGRERVLSVSKHVLGIAGGKTAGLGSEVKENGIRLPLAQGSDGSLVNARDEQGGRSTRAEAVGFNPIGRDVGEMLDSGGSDSQFMGELSGGDGAQSGVAIKVGVEWSVGRGTVGTKMEDTSLASTDRAEDRVPGQPVSECFPTGGVLLVGVSEGDVYPSLHVIRGTLCGGSLLDIGIAKGGVTEAEGLTASTVGGGGEGILAQMAEEAKKKPRTQRSMMAVAQLGSG